MAARGGEPAGLVDLVISAGVGPLEVRRFVGQLAARLERLAEVRGLEVREVCASGEPPRSIALRLAGDPGALADELGTHVLVHAARGRGARKRWFAAVTAHAASAPPDAPAIPRDELTITACRAGGPGGQHVNKVASAVRVEHAPSGLAVRSAGARSQHANLEAALRRLAQLLHARAAAAHAAARATRRGAHYQLERGRPVRRYRLDGDGRLAEVP
jgi:protein subunit release factor B